MAKIRSFHEAKEQKWYELDMEVGELTSRVGHALVNVPSEKKMYMIGGGNHEGETNEIYMIDYSAEEGVSVPEEETKLKVVPMEELTLEFTGRYEFMAGLEKSQKKIWIFGGSDLVKPKNDICYMDLEGGRIVRQVTEPGPEQGEDINLNIPSVRTQGNNSCLLELNGEEYLAVFAGGLKEEKAVPDGNLYIYKLSDNTWTRVEIAGSTPNPAQGHGMVAIGSKVYVHGGMDNFNFCNDLYVIDLAVEPRRWIKFESISQRKPASRAAHGIRACGTDIFICGGVSPDGELADLWKLNTESREWTLINTGKDGFQPRLDFAMSCVTLDDNQKFLIIHGGLNSELGIYNDFWIYPVPAAE